MSLNLVFDLVVLGALFALIHFVIDKPSAFDMVVLPISAIGSIVCMRIFCNQQINERK